ncbi:Dihydroorotate oxidase [Coccomyxa subellipsoidea C-169]|uniref:dihydropyrimidine dehydrogenase (NADP(+)) n=1 Tax=Coccomyxa subellipsoidea (strain C-169) TaxID=574566 RepID=I0YQN5_COCSC|nr:Dihydroorotate oxidase [Coccomyxa subellipsoidea C-169]EIE20704.1 Dihydroorotate oxidase [Coccomyxa subellipsoidea C-169]|eukprot:XP_005645248.1 Dihydroorotate oxidase [Coccomyxa subellipsoidea C-169]
MVHLLQTSLQTWYRHCYSTTLPVLSIITHGCESSVHLCLKYHCVLQVNGKVQSGPDLSITHFSGLKLPNPFVIGSGPPGTNYQVMKKAFDEGWGAVIAKTVSLDSSKVINVTPRYARMKASDKKEVIGWENIELISDRPLEVMLDEFKRLKQEYPDRILIASIMEEYNKAAWEELIARCEQTGVDAFEINFSCPHGMPERKMGMAMGQDCQLLEEVCGWINAKASVPVWAKMTPNITDITVPARTALAAGCEGVAAINTITSVMGINLDTLRPEPSVEGYSTPGGYSSKAVKPIALAKVMSIAQMVASEYGGARDVSAIGGVETGRDAAEFILLGANSVQVCTGVMLHGYPLVKQLCGGLQEFMVQHGFNSVEEFRGASLPYFTTHHELVRMQREAVAAKKRARTGLSGDDKWSGDGFVREAESMVAN